MSRVEKEECVIQYAGDQSFSVVSQMVVLTFAMFVAPASGIAAAFAFIRAFKEYSKDGKRLKVEYVRAILSFFE